MNWLEFDWKTLMDPSFAPVALMFVALACGAIIGSERQKHEKPAGLRTLILVCMGSAAFTMAGYAFTSKTGDSGRVAAQIVTGIGFLGAGVIIRTASGSHIHGLTTAASTWLTASLGIACAVADWQIVIPGLAFTFAILVWGGTFEKAVRARFQSSDETPPE